MATHRRIIGRVSSRNLRGVSVDAPANLRDVDDEVAAAMSDPSAPGPGLGGCRGATADPIAGPMADREHFAALARQRLRERRADSPVAMALGVVARVAVRARGRLIDGDRLDVMALSELLTAVRTSWIMVAGIVWAHCGAIVGRKRRMGRRAACVDCGRLERDLRGVEYCGGDRDPGSSCGGRCPRGAWWPFSALRWRRWLRNWSCPLGLWPEQLVRVGLEDPKAGNAEDKTSTTSRHTEWAKLSDDQRAGLTARGVKP